MENSTPDMTQHTTANPFLIPAAIVIAGALIGGSVLYANMHGAGPARPKLGAAGTGRAVDNAELLATAEKDPRTLGNPDAPVTIVEFADFQCPFCGALAGTQNAASAALKARDSSWEAPLPKIMDTYVKNGKVRFVYHDFAFLGQESQLAAEASRCAQDQNAFWQYHDYLYAHQNGENQGAFVMEHLKEFAKTIKLDAAKFNACLDTGAHRDEVKRDLELGKQLGVDGTPAVFVNDQFFNGALPFKDFQTAIEAALAKAK